METVTDTLSSGWGWMKELISSDNELDRQAKQLIDEAFSVQFAVFHPLT